MMFNVLKFYALLRSRITPNFGSGFLVFNIETAGIVEHLRKHMWPFFAGSIATSHFQQGHAGGWIIYRQEAIH